MVIRERIAERGKAWQTGKEAFIQHAREDMGETWVPLIRPDMRVPYPAKPPTGC